jgi:tRNA(Ile)-lysidine synthase
MVACSGGLDSVACLHVLNDLKVPLEVLHVHHGPSKNQYRNKAAKFVQQLAADLGLPFHFAQSQEPLKSEAQMRKFRLTQWKKWQSTHVVTLAHHQQDLLETRIIRLIRGTGPDGLKSMDFYQGGLFRPLLNTPKEKLVKYMHSTQKKWMEDPTNLDPIYLRNWLRHVWLKDLETFRPGSLNRMSESLSHLVSAQPKQAHHVNAIAMKDYLSRSRLEQIQMLSVLLKSKGVTEFSLSQLKEVQRQLDKDQKRHSFKCAGVIWQVNAQQITLNQ